MRGESHGPIARRNARPRLSIRPRHSARCAANARIELRGPTYDDGELSAIYRSGTVAVVPSTFPEALGLTSLEAQASGVPVVVSDAGGLPETVSPGRSGFVFKNGSATELGELRSKVAAQEEAAKDVAKAKNDSIIWWKRQRWMWVVAVFVGVAIASVSGCIGFVASRFATPALHK